MKIVLSLLSFSITASLSTVVISSSDWRLALAGDSRPWLLACATDFRSSTKTYACGCPLLVKLKFVAVLARCRI